MVRALWLRFVLVGMFAFISSLLVNTLFVAVIAGGVYSLGMERLQNIAANMVYGGGIPWWVPVALTFLITFIIAVFLVFLTVMRITHYLMLLRHHRGENPGNVLKLFFVESWKYFWGYALVAFYVGIMMLGYILAGLILLGIFLTAVGFWGQSIPEGAGQTMAMGIPGFIGIVIFWIGFLYLFVRFLFVPFYYMYFDKAIPAWESFKRGYTMTLGHWWRAALTLFSLNFLLIIMGGILFDLPDFVLTEQFGVEEPAPSLFGYSDAQETITVLPSPYHQISIAIGLLDMAFYLCIMRPLGLALMFVLGLRFLPEEHKHTKRSHTKKKS